MRAQLLGAPLSVQTKAISHIFVWEAISLCFRGYLIDLNLTKSSNIPIIVTGSFLPWTPERSFFHQNCFRSPKAFWMCHMLPGYFIIWERLISLRRLLLRFWFFSCSNGNISISDLDLGDDDAAESLTSALAQSLWSAYRTRSQKWDFWRGCDYSDRCFGAHVSHYTQRLQAGDYKFNTMWQPRQPNETAKYKHE